MTRVVVVSPQLSLINSVSSFLQIDPVPLLRKQFSLPVAVSQAQLFVVGLGYFKVSGVVVSRVNTVHMVADYRHTSTALRWAMQCWTPPGRRTASEPSTPRLM
jgi:hypothetical protein